jgi:predicted metal-dependent hydrolase
MRKYSRSRSYAIRLRRGEIHISLPAAGSYRTALELLEKHRTDLQQRRQTHLQSAVPTADEALLRRQAEAYLPDRVQTLAHRHGFNYSALKINRSRGRWGSCSTKKSINLSHFLMMLPPHLIDYVILHELCHTQIMNHGAGFHQLMDEVTSGRAGALQKELRSVNLKYQ